MDKKFELLSHSVFVKNIAPDAPEERLVELFSQVGPVVNFRLAFNKDTGKSKSFGYCEFADRISAINAEHTLDGREFNGQALCVARIVANLEDLEAPAAATHHQKQDEKGEKRPLEADIETAGTDEPPAKKRHRMYPPDEPPAKKRHRMYPPDEKPASLSPLADGVEVVGPDERFTYIVTELGEEHDATGTHIITGDMAGLEDFEALLIEGKALDDKTNTTITAFVLGAMAKPTYENGFKKGRPLWEKMRVLYMKYNFTHACYEPFQAEVQGCFRNVNYFIISGVY
jgi:hypothetical protein